MSFGSRCRVPEPRDQQVPGGRKAAGLFTGQKHYDVTIDKLAPSRTKDAFDDLALNTGLMSLQYWRSTRPAWVGKSRPIVPGHMTPCAMRRCRQGSVNFSVGL